MKAPVMFISHGSPTYALSPGKAGAGLKQASSNFTDVKGIILVSAHWFSRTLEIMSIDKPETIHDFGGFPDELYQIQYPAPGDPELADKLLSTLNKAGFDASLNMDRGLDHGAWVPMLHLFPDADMPIVEVSISHYFSRAQLFELGKTLSSLRDQGYAIIGSGSLTHNLRDVRWGDVDPLPYVESFQQDIKDHLNSGDFDTLVNRAENISAFTKAHPTDDHYLPLVFALGAVEDSDSLEVLEGGIEFGALSMDSYLWH